MFEGWAHEPRAVGRGPQTVGHGPWAVRPECEAIIKKLGNIQLHSLTDYERAKAICEEAVETLRRGCQQEALPRHEAERVCFTRSATPPAHLTKSTCSIF